LPPLAYTNHPEEHIHREGSHVAITKKIIFNKDGRSLERNIRKYIGGEA
jgi:hypothetical protein